MKLETLDDLKDCIKLIYCSIHHHKTLYFQMQFISIRSGNNFRESIESEIILTRPKQFIAIKRELEKSQVPEMLSAKKQTIKTLDNFISEANIFVIR